MNATLEVDETAARAAKRDAAVRAANMAERYPGWDGRWESVCYEVVGAK